MSRGQGQVFRPVDGKGRRQNVWWLDYTVGGKRHRESSGTTNKSEAQRILRSKMGDREVGKIIGRPERVFLAEYEIDAEGKKKLVGGLRWLHETQMQLDSRRSLDRQRQCWNQLEKFFPAPTPVTTVTPLRLIAYQQKRLAEEAAPQTVGNELSALRRGFSLAVDKELLARAPKISIPKADNIREGFFEDDDFAAVLLDLPPYGQAPIRFCRFTGWRIEEVLTLSWDRVDWEHQGIRLSPRQTKGKKARLFPFGMAPELKALLEAAWQVRQGPFVFQGPRKGERIGYTTLLHHWQRATKRAGCEDRIIHDLRRTAVRDFVQAGVDRETIKALCGMHTDSIFVRYHIVNDTDLAAAVAKRFSDKVTTRSGVVSPS